MSSVEVGRLLDAGIEAVKKGDYPAAIELWSKAIELDPNDDKVLTNRATAYKTIGNLNAALADIDASLKINPNTSHIYFSRANIYDRQGKYKEAIADLNKVIELDPNDADAYYNRANITSKAYRHLATFFTGDKSASKLIGGGFNQVMDDYTQAIKLKPNVSQMYANRSGIQFELLMRMKAQATQVQNPNIPKTFQPQTMPKFDPALANEPLKDINKAIELDPNAADYWKNRAIIKLMLLNQLPECILDLNRAIELDPQFVDALVFRCNAYNQTGQTDKAVADATSCIKLQPNEPNHYFNRAMALRKLNDHQGALNDLSEVIQRDPKNVKAYPNRAECYTALGKKTLRSPPPVSIP